MSTYHLLKVPNTTFEFSSIIFYIVSSHNDTWTSITKLLNLIIKFFCNVILLPNYEFKPKIDKLIISSRFNIPSLFWYRPFNKVPWPSTCRLRYTTQSVRKDIVNTMYTHVYISGIMHGDVIKKLPYESTLNVNIESVYEWSESLIIIFIFKIDWI